MDGHQTSSGVLGGVMAIQFIAHALAAPTMAFPMPSSPGVVERHHYSVSARVRPLLVFWIRCSDVGDAVVTRRRGVEGSGYSLLIGSDPDRAPRAINRWGYIDEDIRGDEAHLIGLMTESDEQSVEEAEAHLRQGGGERIYQVIQATIEGENARSVVGPIHVPTAYSFRQLRTVLDLARQESKGTATRSLQIPRGTRPGFLSAVADLVDQHVRTVHETGAVSRGQVVTYVYHGRLYQLRATDTTFLQKLRVGASIYPHVIAAEFEIRNIETSELTPFSMTYAVDGPLAGVPLTASYEPRWWIRIDLSLNDLTTDPLLGG